MQILRAEHGSKYYEDALSVRRQVFIDEQQVPEELEIDEFEEDAVHFVAYHDELPVGAGRMRLKNNKAKAERICVLSSCRGLNVGRTLMDALENEAQKDGAHEVVLHAQTQAIPFYQKLTYTVTSSEFLDAGIPHREMRKILD